MTVFDVLVNTDDLVVLGPPELIELSVSVGEQGTRGATFFAGSGNPNDPITFDNVFGDETTPVEGDLYINTATGVEYGWLYIYNPKEDTSDSWDSVLRMQQPFYSQQVTGSFSGGAASFSIPLSSILTPGFSQSDVNKYIVNVTALNNNPVALSVSSKVISGSNFQFTVKAVEFNTAWSNVNSTMPLMVNISVVV